MPKCLQNPKRNKDRHYVVHWKDEGRRCNDVNNHGRRWCPVGEYDTLQDASNTELNKDLKEPARPCENCLQQERTMHDEGYRATAF